MQLQLCSSDSRRMEKLRSEFRAADAEQRFSNDEENYEIN